jgi:hypothetical protein
MNMKKVIYALILPMVVISGIVFANRVVKSEDSYKPSPKSSSVSDTRADSEEIKKWKASLYGGVFKEWELSFEREKVLASAGKIRMHLAAFTNMEAVVTSLTIPLQANGEASTIKGLMVSINGQPYIVQFGTEDLKQLRRLKVNDKIVIKSRSARYLPNYSYLVLSGDYVERNHKVIFKRDVSMVGC